MKRICLILLSLVLIAILAIPVLATPVRLVDNADLLTALEKDIVSEKLNEVSQKWSMDIVIVTADSLNGATPADYADDYFDCNGYGYGSEKDGILLLISMEDRDWAISASGRACQVFTYAGQGYIMDEVLLFLSDDDFYNGFMAFADQCDDFCRQAAEGTPYDGDNLPQEPIPFFLFAIISVVVGLIVGLIVTRVMKAQLKTVHSQSTANDYIKSGSMRITQSTDLFLYRNVTRVPRPKQTSGGSGMRTSSSGRVHSGRSGKF